MNFKRRKAKSQRAGCLFCKPWKHQRVGRQVRKGKGRGGLKLLPLRTTVEADGALYGPS